MRPGVRAVVARTRRGLRDRVTTWRSPRATGFRWLRVVDDRGSVAWGSSGLALDQQPSDRVVVGDDVWIGDHVEFHLGPDGRVVLGDDVVIGHHTTIAADVLVRVEAGAEVGAYAVLTDTWTYGRPPRPGHPWGPPAQPVVIGAGARLGMRAMVGPGIEVAPGDTVAAATVVHADLLPAGPA